MLTARYGLSPYMKQTLVVFKGLNTVQCRISLFCLMYLYVTKFRYFNERKTQTTTRGDVRRDGGGSTLLDWSSNSLSGQSFFK